MSGKHCVNTIYWVVYRCVVALWVMQEPNFDSEEKCVKLKGQSVVLLHQFLYFTFLTVHHESSSVIGVPC